MKPSPWFYGPVLFVVGMVLHAWLILRWPVIFGGDTILRMANRDHILLSYQLPGLQAALHYLAGISESAVLARYFMAMIGAIAGVGFYLLATHFMDQKRAFLTALLFATNPFLLALSTVPYQEILMLAGLFFAFHFFLSGKLAAASLSLGLACFTRYEAWAACPVLVLALAIERRWRPVEAVKAVLLFAWAPLVWMLYQRGLSPEGTFVMETNISLWRFARYAYLGWITVKNTPLPVLVLTLMGATRIWRERASSYAIRKQPGRLILTAFLALFLISILFSAHGVSPDPERFVTAREAHLPICAVVLIAGFGLAQFARVPLILLFLGMGLGIYDAGRFVARETSPPGVQLGYDLARYLDVTLQDEERVILLVKPFPRVLYLGYLDKVFQRGGPAAVADARRVMRSMDTSPPDFQRTLVHSRLGRQRLLSFGGATVAEWKESEWPDTRAEWLAVWSDFTPGNPLEERIYALAVKNHQPVHILKSGPLSVSIYHTAAGK